MTPQQDAPEKNTRSFVFGTAGHIDHGKTALVFALTGTDTDRLPEEKRRGITIDLGFASLRLEDATRRAFEISLIDVPGHHAFIRNMLAGTGGIDGVLLVIAADEGVKAQTIEHLSICNLLGIRQGIVVLTKKDAVSADRLDSVSIEVRRLLHGTFLEDARILPVSARTREGIAELKRELQRLSLQMEPRGTDIVPRLPVDRAFTMRGFGTVVTGTLQSGVLRAGDSLQLQPDGRTVRVRGMQVHGNPQAEAHGPCRVALNLAGVDVAQVQRGNTLTFADTLTPVSTLDVEVAMLAQAPALKHRSRVSIHAFTSDTLATVLLYEALAGNARVPQQSSMLVRLHLARPMLVVPGDRFVMRQCSPSCTIGGGRVLDSYPIPRLRKALAHRWLQQLWGAPASQQLLLRILRRGLAGISVRDLVAETGLTPGALRRIAKPLLEDGQLVGANNFSHFIGSEPLTQSSKLLFKLIEGAKAAPIPQAELQSRAKLNDWVFELALERLLSTNSVETQGEFLSLPRNVDLLQARNEQRLAEVEQLYLDAALAPPIASQIACRLGISAEEMHHLITILLRAKKLVRLGADNLFVHREALEHFSIRLRNYRGEHFDIPRFKALTCLTRKHAIPLLEHLDRARITRNIDGIRIVL